MRRARLLPALLTAPALLAACIAGLGEFAHLQLWRLREQLQRHGR